MYNRRALFVVPLDHKLRFVGISDILSQRKALLTCVVNTGYYVKFNECVYIAFEWFYTWCDKSKGM